MGDELTGSSVFVGQRRQEVLVARGLDQQAGHVLVDAVLLLADDEAVAVTVLVREHVDVVVAELLAELELLVRDPLLGEGVLDREDAGDEEHDREAGEREPDVLEDRVLGRRRSGDAVAPGEEPQREADDRGDAEQHDPGVVVVDGIDLDRVDVVVGHGAPPGA